MRTGVYLRISEDRAGDELGVERQREDADKLATARGWTVVEHYVDNDTSAAGKVARPRFEAMVNDIISGRIEVVIGWSFDRICRTARDRLRLLEIGRDHGLVISLVRGSDMHLGTPAGRLAADILGSVAQHEIDQKADRQKRAALQAARLGKPPAGPVPFGFRPDRVTHEPEQAEAIREAYSLVLNGASLRSVANRWNAAGLVSGKTRTGRRAGQPSQWSPETVKALLLKARNAGLREHKGEILAPATWAPIVPEETYAAVRALLTDPSRRGAPPSARHLLSGVALCGVSVCGDAVVAGSTRPRYFAYRCRTRGHIARRGDHVDAYIAGGTIEGVELRGLVVERLSRPDAIDLLPRETGPDLRALRDAVAAARMRLDTIAAEFADDDTITAAQFRTMTGRARERLAVAQAQLAAAGRTSVLAPLITADDTEAAWRALDVDRQRTVIDLLMRVVLHPVGQGARYFDPNSITVEWKADEVNEPPP